MAQSQGPEPLEVLVGLKEVAPQTRSFNLVSAPRETIAAEAIGVPQVAASNKEGPLSRAPTPTPPPPLRTPLLGLPLGVLENRVVLEDITSVASVAEGVRHVSRLGRVAKP